VCIQHLETQNYTTTNQHEKTPAPSRKRKPRASLMLATTIHESNTTPHHQVERKQNPSPVSHNGDEEMEGLLPQSPIVCPMAALDSPLDRGAYQRLFIAPEPDPLQTASIQRIAQVTEPPHDVGGPWVSWCSLERR